MIYIHQNSGNTAIFTLAESTTLSATNVYYLFEFINPETDQDILFTATDLSSNKVRYNQFTIYETGSTQTDYSNGIVSLKPQGFWNYNVYQQLSATNLFLSGVTGGVIENGKVLVSGNSLSIATTTLNNPTTTRFVLEK